MSAKSEVSIDEYIARVGGEPFVSKWFPIPQDRIDAFAEVTEDRQFIHVDPEAAKATPFGGTIAHGFLTLSMLSAMAYDALPEIKGRAMGVNYGFDRVRFVSPAPSGAQLRGRFALVNVLRRSPKDYVLTHEVTLEIEGHAKPALVATWLTMSVMT